ncbi:MAG: nucleoside-diphosphate kinase, partial [Actinomycetota bacterium]
MMQFSSPARFTWWARQGVIFPASCRRLLGMSNRTLVLLKPDAVERALVGNILSRFEAKGLKIVAMELRKLDNAIL